MDIFHRIQDVVYAAAAQHGRQPDLIVVGFQEWLELKLEFGRVDRQFAQMGKERKPSNHPDWPSGLRSDMSAVLMGIRILANINEEALIEAFYSAKVS